MKNIFKRIYELLIKTISIKGAAFIIASIALLTGKFLSWEWLIITGLVIGGRTIEKISGVIKKEV